MIQYRREIDGLRALAVLPVIFFHAGFEAFSGGFVGVDVFFVISGYLITSLILLDIQHQTFSLRNFYERRARRILPALYFVMATCIPFAWFGLQAAELRDFFESLFAVPLFLSNHLFLSESGYFETAAELKPLLHTWSLAVEEQYYLLFPLLLLGLWKMGKQATWAALVFLFMASLGLAHWASVNHPSAAFFTLPTRFWELLVGSLLALHVHHSQAKPSNERLAWVGSASGLGLIVFSIVAFSKATPFPSLFTLLPTLGTAMIILYASPANWVGRLLASKPFVGVGLISYSAYLWHQPVFAFVREFSLEKPSNLTFLGLIALVLLLATLTWHWVEKPFRDRTRFTGRAIFTWAALASALLCTLGVIGHTQKGFPDRFENTADFEKLFVAGIAEPACEPSTDSDGFRKIFCELGASRKPEAPVNVALFGDSHAARFVLPIDLLGKQHRMSAAYLGLGGCPPLIGVDVIASTLERGWCARVAQLQLDYAKTMQVKTVILASRWSLFTNGDEGKRKKNYFLVDTELQSTSEKNSRAVFVKGLQRTIKAYESLGAQVFIVLQVPQQEAHPKKIYFGLAQSKVIGTETAARAARDHSVSSEKHRAAQLFNQTAIRSAVEGTSAKVIDPSTLFCKEGKCLIGEKDRAFYYDHDHLTSHAALMLTPFFESVFTPEHVQ